MAKRTGAFVPHVLLAADNVFDGEGRLVQAHLKWCKGYVEGYAKWDLAGESEYCVANEFVCAELGKVLRLPVPPVSMTWLPATRRVPIFFAVDLNNTKTEWPPVEPESCVARLPRLCSLVVAFDILIANPDRHDKNLSVNNPVKPSEMAIFDHGQALFGPDKGKAIERFHDIHGTLGLGTPRYHCLMPHLTSAVHLYEACQRVKEIQRWLISDVVETAAVTIGIPEDEASRCINFLDDRRRHLWSLITQFKAEFPSISDWTIPESHRQKELFE